MLGAVAFLFGLHHALNWAWEWSLQTGNIFIQISVPTRLLVFTGMHLVYWIVSGVGLAILVGLGTTGRKTALQPGQSGTAGLLWTPRFRFYPLTFALGLFLAYFGTVFLFNASVTGDDTPAGYVAFVYLNYAGVVRRGLISIVALVLIITGLVLAVSTAFRRGVGAPDAPKTIREPVTAVMVSPQAPAKAAPTAHVAPRPRPAPLDRAAPSPAAAQSPATSRMPTRGLPRAASAPRRRPAPSTGRSL